MTLAPFAIILTDSSTGREGAARVQAGQESLKSHDDPRALLWGDRETKKQSCGVAASPRVKKRSVATGSGVKVP